MELNESQKIIDAALSFIIDHEDPKTSHIPDTMEVLPHTHGLDDVLKHIYSLRNIIEPVELSQLESDILAIRNEVEILLFAFPASAHSISKATEARNRILLLLKP